MALMTKPEVTVLIHNYTGLKADMGCPRSHEPLDKTRVMGEERHHVEARVGAGGDDDDGSGGDSNGSFTMATHRDAVARRLNVERLVDGILTELPEPAEHHIFPEIQEYECAWPVPCPAV